MNIRIVTSPVSGNYIDVYNKFDIHLFKFLLPGFLPIRIEKFEGSRTGDIVQMKAGLWNWKSLITFDVINDTEASFTDEGIVLPFPLKDWRHRHIIENISENSCRIIDDIDYSTGKRWMDLLIRPFMKRQFSLRIKLYKRYFGKWQNE